MRDIRGGDISMIFQEPMASFSLVHTVGDQIMEGVMMHQDVSKAEARNLTIEMLGRVGIPHPERRIDEYPFTLSGGMRQRCMIAMALVNHPKLVIADEPTTALDVTTQAQILELMIDIQAEFGMAIMLISHNLGVIAQMAEKVIVMYLGKVIEEGDVDTIFGDPKHPYTQELLNSIPRLGRTRQTDELSVIRGSVPSAYFVPPGCAFHPRCPSFIPGVCDVTEPQTISLGPEHTARCLLYSDVDPKGSAH
jgi:peptide/nickel transport system ATP-binding protein